MILIDEKPHLHLPYMMKAFIEILISQVDYPKFRQILIPPIS